MQCFYLDYSSTVEKNASRGKILCIREADWIKVKFFELIRKFGEVWSGKGEKVWNFGKVLVKTQKFKLFHNGFLKPNKAFTNGFVSHQYRKLFSAEIVKETSNIPLSIWNIFFLLSSNLLAVIELTQQ